MWIISFWMFPLISACMWLSMLISMLVIWVNEGKPHYASMDDGQTIAYISDVGAQHLKPLFVAGSAVTVVFLDLAFLSERWLRHSGQLASNKGRLDKTCAILSIFFAIAGAAGLILLSVFDTLRHPKKHDGFIALFIAGYVISAILVCIEYLRIGIFYRREHRVLLVSFFIKLVFVIVELALAIGFGVCIGSNKASKQNPGAVLEWCIAFVFTGYVLSFVVDLLPSVRTRNHVPQGEKYLMSQAGFRGTREEAVSIEEPLTHDSMGPSTGYYRGQRV
ncbi:Frag1/DRAM/Sfk1 [Penicillium griseofulvum]|uniref:Frag1/DRAM/Sfk1 n=1 Tax=Penicillium patulum TaxID=5078 RepID=A0A135L8R5_PENPA|nr:Frag1/DRAM/Sfk1 [Penicillium griseofulvum]KXG45357.1 Frag1/DRAM/Sfk1 [Penicillium griseofulvum]